MERASLQPGFSFTSLVRGVLLFCCLALLPTVVRADEKSATEPKPISLELRDNAVGAATLVGNGFEGHPGFTQLLYYVHGLATNQFQDLTPRLAGSDRALACAAALAVSGGLDPAAPLNVLALVRGGETLNCWELFDPDVVRPLKKDLFSAVLDERGMPDRIGETKQAEFEAEVFYDAILKANRTRPEVFDRSVRRDDGSKQPIITYAHLFREPKKYRGEVVRIEGKIRRIRKDPSPAIALQMAGVKETYECWLFNDEYGPNNPVCLITTELPPGLKVKEKILKEYPVAFVGYFFKKYRYEAGSLDKPKQLHDAPLLVGHIIPLAPIDPDEDDDAAIGPAMGQISTWTKNLLIAFLLVVGVTVVVVGWLSWWFKRGDEAVRMRVAARNLELPEPDRPPDEDNPPDPIIPLPARRGLEQPPPN